MKKLVGLAMVALLGGCGVELGNGSAATDPPAVDDTSTPTGEGGANANDRTSTTDPELLAGAMAVSPTGNFIVARRNTTTLIVDVRAQSLVELPLDASWFVFAKARDVVYVQETTTDIVALDLATRAELWRAEVPAVGRLLAKVSADDSMLILTDGSTVYVVDAVTGATRSATSSETGATDLELSGDGRHAFVVGRTAWTNGGPHTPVSIVPLDGTAASTIDVPNCAAPLALMPDGTRAFLSPTFCTPDAQAKARGWSNPDPVSVIDIDAAATKISFNKNLPGFGPVALLGDRVVAYLDTKRMDPAMFADPSQVPGKDAAEYQLMTIEPKTLAFGLHPIGPALPRFAPSRDGRSLLVDASVQVHRFEAKASASAEIALTPDGQLTADVKISAFGDVSGSLFGVFSLDTNAYTPFQGPAAALDRFVQNGDGTRVFTLETNDRGGDLFGIDVGGRASFDLGMSLRDIAILPDGRTLVLRIREERTDGYIGEKFCFSLDARACMSTVEYVSPVPQHDP